MGQSPSSSPDVGTQRQYEYRALENHMRGIENECKKLLTTVSNIRTEFMPIQDKRKYVDTVLKDTMQRLGLQISSCQPGNMSSQEVRVGDMVTPKGLGQPDEDTARQMTVFLQQKHELQEALNDVDQNMMRWQVEKNDMARNREQRCREIESENNMLKKNLDEMVKQKEDALVRLSALISDRLHANNPDIVDLSDSNRPTKLGEVYAELYDNEWTDAFQALTNSGYTDEYAIETLRLTLMNCWTFSKEIATQIVPSEALQKMFGISKNDQKQFSKTINHKSTFPCQSFRTFSLEEGFWLQARLKLKETSSKQPSSDLRMTTKTWPFDIELRLRSKLKEVAESWVPCVQMAYFNSVLDPSGLLPEMIPYIKKCLFVTWMMAVQTPPMWLDGDTTSGKPFDKTCYKEYMKGGPKVAFVVWPAVKLHEHGPLIGKGVAQGISE